MRIVAAALLGVLISAALSAQSALQTRLVVGEGLREPFAVDFDASGRMFIAEHAGNRVSIWAEGTLTPLATPFGGPHHLLRGPDDQIYVADTWNNAVRRVDPRTGAVTTLAGTGAKGFAGDGGRAIDAQFGSLFAIDIRRNTLFIAACHSATLRCIEISTADVSMPQNHPRSQLSPA